MEILRVFNNNVVLARDDAGTEVVLTGRGLGFQARPGHPVDAAKVARTFVPSDGRDPDNLGALIAEIPPEQIQLADEALDLARRGLRETIGTSVVVAVADHLNFALHRLRQSIDMEYPLQAEVAHLYPAELAVARRIVAFVNERLDVELPEAEAVPITLHLVNAGFATGDLSSTYQMTGVFQQIFEVIAGAYGHSVDTGGVSAARFITHLRYFFVRVKSERQLAQGASTLTNAIRDAYPEAYQCALRIQALLELRLGQPISDDEVVYLTLHVERLTSPLG